MFALFIVTRTCDNYRNKIICERLEHLRANYSNHDIFSTIICTLVILACEHVRTLTCSLPLLAFHAHRRANYSCQN